ncbi:MAG: hypothetical protein L0K69_07585, partial [Enterobacterales bacterium]|nr:hypothetical protein [Enterobacterales bacterium]
LFQTSTDIHQAPSAFFMLPLKRISLASQQMCFSATLIKANESGALARAPNTCVTSCHAGSSYHNFNTEISVIGAVNLSADSAQPPERTHST